MHHHMRPLIPSVGTGQQSVIPPGGRSVPQTSPSANQGLGPQTTPSPAVQGRFGTSDPLGTIAPPPDTPAERLKRRDQAELDSGAEL